MENMKHAITFDFITNEPKDLSSCDTAGMKEAIFFDSPNVHEDSFPETPIDKKEAIYFEPDVTDEQGQVYTVKLPQNLVGEVSPKALTLQEVKDLGVSIDQNINTNMIPPSCSDNSMDDNQKATAYKNSSDEIISNSFNIRTSSVEPGILSASQEILAEERNILSISKNASLPETPLTEPCIYMPAPLNNSEFVSTEVVESEERNNQLPVKIFKAVKTMEKMRSYKNDLYFFNSEKGIYQKLSSSDLHYIINRYYGDMIEKQGNTSCYYTVEDFLKKDSSLVVNEAHLLPLDYWGFHNGFYNIYNVNHTPNDGTYFVRHVLQCDFKPKASCPAFDTYIHSIAAGDERLITRLWEVLGYLLSNDTNGKALIAFIGRKDTGKSLLANIISRIVGEESISHLSANDFSGRFDVSELNGKHLNVCMDLPDRALSPDAVGKIKSITGNDVIRSDVKHKDSISFKPTARLLFGSNSLIRTELPDSAFYDRLIVIPFLYPVPKDKQDHRLEEKLVAEASGICLKAMEYYKQLRSRGYLFTEISPPDGLDSSINYDKVVQNFVVKCCEVTQNSEDKIPSEDLYKAFEDYCHYKNIAPLKQADFSKRFKDSLEGKVEKKKIRFDQGSLQGFTGVRLKG
ncbi:phage/plasmid primase, P4 family [Lachnospiraceae bacterium 54-53]